MEIIDLQMPSKCCPNSLVPVRRYVATQRVADPSAGSVYFSQKTSGPNVTAYKALSYAHGTRFKYEVKRVGLIGSSGRIGQLAQAVGSYVLPGDISPLRSPVRSAVYSAITPGLPGGRGLRRPGKRNRTSRCPEGYQYGGRFTDNQFSTCGQKLFDIPGPLGAAISAITRAVRRLEQATISDVKPNPIGPGEYGDPVIQARRPEIPRVGNANVKQRLAEVERLAREMGAPNISATRMVRRDGYVLEPVVSPKVLRAIPDNRDMENATYLLRINNVPSIGQDELGLLSNTGITNVTWVLPGGSTLSVEKVRALTVGERRKLGRTVNAVAKLDNSENPSARLQKLVEETGDGLKYSENFIDIKRPHELIASRNGKQTERWVNELFKKKPEKETSSNRESSSISSIKDRITSLSEAIDHIAAGGSLSEVSPEVLQKALSQVGLFKRRNLGNGVEMFEGPNKKSYLSMRPRSDFAHLDDSFASDFQQHLGLESPDVYRLGKGKRAPYLVESTSNVFPGYEKNKDVTLPEASPQKMAALLVSDFVNGTKNRNPGTVDVYKRDKANDIAVSDLGSELTELSKISIVARQKNAVEDMDSLAEEGTFGRYFRELQKEQQRIFIRELKKLLDKARSFNFVNYKERLVRDGILTDQERNHLEIVKTITEQRLNTLEKQQDVLLAILGGRK